MIVVECASCHIGNHAFHVTQTGNQFKTVACPCTGDCGERYERRLESQRQSDLAQEGMRIEQAMILLENYGFQVISPAGGYESKITDRLFGVFA